MNPNLHPRGDPDPPDPMEFMSTNVLGATGTMILDAAAAFHQDEEFHSWMCADPRGALADKGILIPPGMEIRVVANTPDTFHVSMPPDPNIGLSDEDLQLVAGGKSASTAGSAGTASTFSSLSCPISTLGTASSTSSAGSAGTAG